MAQSPSIDDSPQSVERAARRHQRLTTRTKDAPAGAIAQRIEAPRATLAEKIRALGAAEEAQEDALDDWIADDDAQGDLVYSLSRKAEDYDADHPGARTHELLFRGEAPSDITGMNREEEPDVIVKIIKRGEALAEDHPGRAVLTAMAAAVEQTRTSERAYFTAVTATAEADAAADAAKLVVIQAYRDNIIDITRERGDDLAERCFPKLRHRRRNKKKTPPAA